MTWLKQHPSWIIANTDKNLGPCVIEHEQYIKDALVHLQDSSIYEFLTEAEAKAEGHRLYREIMEWIFKGKRKQALGKQEVQYLVKHTADNCADPHGYFYLMYKVHKKILSTRPVCSDCASITNPIGKWVDVQLQPVAQSMPTFFKDSFAFKKLLETLITQPGIRGFSADAVGMYTNIHTGAALAAISKYLRDNEQRFDYHAETLIRALEIVMNNNIIRFGDTYVRQISGTAMGKPPAPPWAIIFEGIHEIQFLPQWQSNLLLYVRFIDDVFGLWIPSEDEATDTASWLALQAEVNNNHGLEWIFTKRQESVDFLDLTVQVRPDGYIKTTLFEKPMALYLFIPPHSAHPPGVLAGHIFGNVLRIFRLNTEEEDIIKDVTQFMSRFQRRGHTREVLVPIFLKAISNARKFIATTEKERNDLKEAKHKAAKRRLYLHLEYHPQNPQSKTIQQLFRDTVLQPPGKEPINEIVGSMGYKIPIDAMIIANHTAPNLGDKFSYRDISKRTDRPPVSSFL